MCILFVLLKVVTYYDLRVLSMDISDGFQKKSLDGGGWGELFILDFWKNFNFAKPLIELTQLSNIQCLVALRNRSKHGSNWLNLLQLLVMMAFK